MWKLATSLYDEVVVACSGGPDSMALLDFLQQQPKRKVSVAYFNHATVHGDEAEAFVRAYCLDKGLWLYVDRLMRDCPKGASKEAFWRDSRYQFLDLLGDLPVMMGHNLDDQVGTWLMTCLTGNPTLIPAIRGKYHRPLLHVRKDDLRAYCYRNKVPFVEDPSNEDSSYKRNLVRKRLLGAALEVNPGLYKTIENLSIRSTKITSIP